MGDCKCLHTKVTVSGDVHAKVSIGGQPTASVSVDTVTIRDGTNDYNRLVNQPSIEGHILLGNSTIAQIGVGEITPQEIDQLIYG